MRVDPDKILAACDDRFASRLSDAIDWETLRAMALELVLARRRIAELATELSERTIEAGRADAYRAHVARLEQDVRGKSDYIADLEREVRILRKGKTRSNGFWYERYRNREERLEQMRATIERLAADPEHGMMLTSDFVDLMDDYDFPRLPDDEAEAL